MQIFCKYNVKGRCNSPQRVRKDYRDLLCDYPMKSCPYSTLIEYYLNSDEIDEIMRWQKSKKLSTAELWVLLYCYKKINRYLGGYSRYNEMIWICKGDYKLLGLRRRNNGYVLTPYYEDCKRKASWYRLSYDGLRFLESLNLKWNARRMTYGIEYWLPIKIPNNILHILDKADKEG